MYLITRRRRPIVLALVQIFSLSFNVYSMNTKYIAGSMLIFLVMGLMSCQKYLNIPERSDYVAVKTASDCQLLLDDYLTMNASYPSDMIISSDEYFVTDGTASSNAESE